EFAHLLLDALDAGADRGERIFRPAFGTMLWLRNREPREVAHQAPRIAMLDEPAVGLRRLHAVAAGLAERERGVAAPVHVEERLLAAQERLGGAAHELGRQPASLLGRIDLEVDKLDVRQFGDAVARGQ